MAVSDDGISLSIPHNPVPASRPRVSKWGTYYGKNYQKWRKAADQSLSEVPFTGQPFEGPVSVITEVVTSRPKTTQRTYPRGDNDNFEKAAWDAITQARRFWIDDDQIVFNATAKRYSGPDEAPATRIYISAIGKTE